MDKNYLNKYNRCLYEYISLDNTIDEADPSMQQQGQPAQDPAMAQQPTMPQDQMAADPNQGMPMQGQMAADPTMGQALDPNAAQMPQDPAMAPNAAAQPMPDANMDQQQGANGFTPTVQPTDVNNDTSDKDKEDAEKEKNEVNQAKAEEKIDALSGKFEELLNKIDSLQSQIDANSSKMDSFVKDMDKRNPSPEEKLSLRSRNSGPFTETPDEYWDKKEATSDYSTEDDKNGEDMPKYQISKADIDSVNDWRNISKSFDDERLGLKDLLGY